MRFRSRAGSGAGFETLALDRVSLRITAGDLVVIMGASGSGKSTLLHVLAGLAQPDSGSVAFRRDADSGAVALEEASEDERARIRGRDIGFVYQAFNLIPTMTAAENVALPLLFRGVPLGERLRRATKMIEDVGLPKHAARYPAELSGGEQQRIAISRALVFNPAVVLADEPTGSLDSKSSGAVLDVLRKLHDERAITIVLVTHDDDVAKRFDQASLIEMRDGRVYRKGRVK